MVIINGFEILSVPFAERLGRKRGRCSHCTWQLCVQSAPCVGSSVKLVAMPFAPSSFLFLVVRPGAPSSVLVVYQAFETI